MSIRLPVIGALLVTISIAAASLAASSSLAQERTVDVWIAALRDDDWQDRRQAAEALGTMKDSYAMEPLTNALSDEVPEVRAAAASALGAIGDSYSVEPLLSRLQDKDASVRRASADALTKITGQKFGEDAGRWRAWWEENQDLGGGY